MKRLASYITATSLIALSACQGDSNSLDTEIGATRAPIAQRVDDTLIETDRGDNWLSYGRDHSEQRFSPLNDINDGNIDKLGIAWSYSLPDARSLVATPLVVDGIMYFPTDFSVVYALDASTGKEIWRYDPQVREVAGKSLIGWPNSKGLAFWKGKIYVATMDGRLIALDATTGDKAWSIQTLDNDAFPRYINGAPRVFDGKVIIGNGGADFYPIRGYVTAYDAETGDQVWRFYTVPGDPAEGFENDAMAMAARTWTGEWWKHGGGGTVWNGFTYDKKYDRVLIGTGNGSPWNREVRSPGGGDNLFLSSVVALDADTGEYQWHYQTSPGDSWDYNSCMDMVLATVPVDGKDTEVILHAPKNGFFYVLERESGKLLSAEKIGRVNWAERVDIKTGRPVENPRARYVDSAVEIWPSSYGAHNWMPMSYSADTGYVYIPYREKSSVHSGIDVDPKSWQRRPYAVNKAQGLDLGKMVQSEIDRGELLAWDPAKQQAAWRRPIGPSAVGGGILSTAGNLVLQGDGGGSFTIYTADSGKELWRWEANWGIVGAPISYRVDGEQYIAIGVGWGASPARMNPEKKLGAPWQYGKGTPTMVAFKLGGSAPAPQINHGAGPLLLFDDPDTKIETDSIDQAMVEYQLNCGVCHGARLAAAGGAPDLRTSRMAAYLPSLKAVLRDGLLESKGMPRFSHLTEEQIKQIHAAIRQTVRNQLGTQSSPILE